jgi:predicted nucleic acid-binding protein
VRLVADANVLLSAVLGGRARAVLEHAGVTEVFTAEVTFAEVQEYAAGLAAKKRLSLDIVLMAVATLPIKVVEREVYERSIPEARRRIGQRDPDDVEILALALHAGVPVWSNDNDFEDAGIEWFTTAELLERLGRGR